MALAITGAICDIIDASLLKLNAYYRCNKSSENFCFALDTDDINPLPSLMSKMTMSETIFTKLKMANTSNCIK